jgi:hypothetical protein
MATNNALGSSLYNAVYGSGKGKTSLSQSEMTYSSFSGADIIAYMGPNKVASLQGITVSITRETMPIFVFGNPNPVAFVQGKRAIAGNLVFSQFDRHAILKMSGLIPPNVTHVGDLNTFQVPNSMLITGQSSATSTVSNIANAFGNSPNSTQANPGLDLSNATDLNAAIEQQLAETYALVSARSVRYSDQVPPFDITITMVNQLGQCAFTAIQYVQLVNEGFGYTLDDLNPEAAFTFVARAVVPLNSILNSSNTNQYWNDSIGGGVQA